jgi:hypothetical protein
VLSDETNIQNSSLRMEDLSLQNYLPSHAIPIDFQGIVLSLEGVCGTLKQGEKCKNNYKIICKLAHGSCGEVHVWQRKDN